MNQRILWVDDIRNPFKIMKFGTECSWVLDFYQAKNMLDNCQDFTAIYLDNDLGSETAPQGKDVLLVIEEMLFNNQLPYLDAIYLHSDNASAVNGMLSAKENFRERYGVDIIRHTLSRSAYN